MEEYFNYQKLLNDATLTIVKDVLKDVSQNGLHGNHHFFISFDTTIEDVKLSKKLRELFPKELTIVLQHQFEDFYITDDKFSVKLSFYGKKEMIIVPFKSITSFVDPSVGFFLTFKVSDKDNCLLKEFKQDVEENCNLNSLASEDKIIDLNKFRQKDLNK